MKPGFSFLIILLFLSGLSQAQVNLDSLRSVIASAKTYAEKKSAWRMYLDYHELRNFDTVIQAGNEALKLARRNGDSVNVAELQRLIGVAFYLKGKYDVAAQYYYASIAILEKANEQRKLALSYNELAKLYRKTRDLDRALENYNKAEDIFRQLKDTGGTAMILNESGVVFEYRGHYDEAIGRYSSAMNLAESINDSLSVSYSLSNIAGVYVIQNKFGEAEKKLLQAMEIRRSMNDRFATALTYTDLGAAMNAKGDYSKAAQYLLESNKIAEQMKYPELQANNYSELASVAQKQGNYQKAYEYFQKKTWLRDSLFNIDKTKQIEEVNARFESVKKEQKIEQQLHRIRLQNFLFAGIAALALLAGLLVYSQYKRNRLRQETKMKTELMRQQEMAVKAVMEAEENERQRIARELHDGVGQMMSAAKMNLSAFESELNFTNGGQKQSFEKIMQLVDESCKEVRTVSHIMMPNSLLKNGLVAAVRDFTEKLDKKTLQVHLYTEGLEERPDFNIESVLYRVLQECVTNVIKHANASALDISIVRDKDGITATIEDNGQGFDINDKEKFEGIGLPNIISRIEWLKGTVDFDSSPGRGTVVALHVPVRGFEV